MNRKACEYPLVAVHPEARAVHDIFPVNRGAYYSDSLRHLPYRLDDLYKNEKDVRVKERLLAICLLYDKKNIYEIAEVLKRSERTIKDWLSRWNKGGYKGLTPLKGGGADPKMPLCEWDNILKEVEGKGMTIMDIVAYVKSNKDVDYSYKTVWRILRVKKK